MRRIYSTIDELLSKSQPIPFSGCFIWDLSVDKTGYARTTNNGKTVVGHRLAYKLAYGDIPEGIFVCHRCDIPSCINPQHLFLGAHSENMKDMVTKKRSAKHERHSQSKLNSEKVKSIRNSNKNVSQISREFGVHRSTIRDVLDEITWKGIT